MSAHNGVAPSATRILGTAYRATELVSVGSMAGMTAVLGFGLLLLSVPELCYANRSTPQGGVFCGGVVTSDLAGL